MAAQEMQRSLAAWGVAQADLASVAALRRALPAWAPADTPGHFLKHADEQTVLAVAALDQAIRSQNLSTPSYSDWAIIAAPRFIGRVVGPTTLDRFMKGGSAAVSPHLIPQHSLHSPSGALSILLGSRKPNFGVGGSTSGFAEALLAALTLPLGDCQGIWLAGTSWDPEPQLDDAGKCTNNPVCYAVALAFQAAAHGTIGHLRLEAAAAPAATEQASPQPADLCRQLAPLAAGGAGVTLRWCLPAGPTLVLDVQNSARSHALAA